MLFRSAIYLGAPLPVRSSRLLNTAGPAICVPTVLLRIEVAAADASTPSGELLPHLSTFACPYGQVTFFCCPFPGVAPGGCYPLSLPYGARTFLTHGPFAPKARLSSLLAGLILSHFAGKVKSVFR